MIKKYRSNNWISWLLIFVIIVSLIGNSYMVYAERIRGYHVKSFDDLLGLVAQSKILDFENEVIYLDEDIEITAIEQATLDRYKIDHLTFGTNKVPFKGVFDGQNHTIKGLNYQKTVLPNQNCGLFSYAKNAIIKNLTIENATLESVYQGGIVVGQANNCTLENITVLNSDLEVKPANNVISLITNGGFCGGAIAGILEDSIMYNCEISGTRVHCNNTAGVAAVGGEGLYMGALVGWASNTTIEYCRARSNYGPDGKVRQSAVSNKYDTAVGALGGKSLYAGGIVGGVNNGCYIYDCFSTADVYFYAANYVSVGSGTAGYGGGIVGALRGGSIVERCHYAGNISSMQYNAVLVIPIIQYDVNICGIARLVKDGSQVIHSYFKPSNIDSGKQITAANNQNTALAYPVNDEDYQDVSFWEKQDYDFVGNVDRITNLHNKLPHSNKWVMDYDLGIPVHGNSVSATFDFPDAGFVTINETMLVNKIVKTNNPYSFAVQGVHARENQQVKLTVNLNDGYRFAGWYKEANVLTHTVDDIQYLLNITGDKDKKLKANATISSTTVDVANNDLFVADVEAEVIYHNVNGEKIGSDWHRYQSSLIGKDPTDAPIGAKFYGWTTIPNKENTGYSSITSTQLNDIKQKKELYKKGDSVKKQMDLYPIYIDSKANIITEFEGHEQDQINDVTKRKNVGHTIVDSDDKGVFIDVIGENMSGTFPDGYRFKGWYRKMDDKGNEVCVSRNQKYYVPDLTEKVTYVARFEYRVDYFAKPFETNGGASFQPVNPPIPYTIVWHDYKEGFKDIGGPAYTRESVIGWGLEKYVNHGKNFTGQCLDKINSNYLITKPITVYSHVTNHYNSVSNNYAVMADTDFPGSGEIESIILKQDLQSEFNFKPLKGYYFNFWTLEREDGNYNDGKWTYLLNPFNTGSLNNTKDYKARAMIYTNINFHKKDDTAISSVSRRYKDKILLNKDTKFTYLYPHYLTNVIVDEKTYDGKNISSNFISQASPTDDSMKVNDYAFLGWISTADVVKDSYEWNYIYDVVGDNYCTSDVDKVQPYLVADNELVYETQDLYPVYAKYDVAVTTNIHQITNLPQDVNKPSIPTFSITPISENSGTANITVIAEDGVKPVLTSDINGTKYQLTGMICEVDGEHTQLTLTKEQNKGIYTGKIKAGKNYRFVAQYSPLLVMYHLNERGTIKTVVKNNGEKISPFLEPDYLHISNISDSCFAGWTQKKKENGSVYKFDRKSDFVSSGIVLMDKNDIVKENMELWPVFVKPSIKVNSNIDKLISSNNENPSEYRSLQQESSKQIGLIAKDYPGYKFTGWYKGYVDDKNLGTLVSEKSQYKLMPQDLYDDTIYTAVFKKAYKINYHDADGNVLYVENVAENRSFVDEKGNAIDIEPILALQNKLKSGQTFSQWQWNHGNKMIDWNNFKDIPISNDMDIYPVIETVTAKDSYGNYCTDSLEMQVIHTNEIDSTAPQDSYTLTGLFKNEYTQPSLILHVEQESWSPLNNKKEIKLIDNLATRIYVKKGTDVESKIVEASKGPILTDINGEALHKFFGKVILNATFTDKNVSGQVFIKIVTPGLQEIREVPIDISNGEGKTIVNLPVGTYIFSEDEKWNWRDTISINGLDSHNSLILKMGDEKKVDIRNNRTNLKWFTSEKHKKNQYK